MLDHYDLEIERAVREIKKLNAKLVAVQLPEGLRPISWKIVDELKKKTGAKILIWMGSCFGACDVPLELERIGVELLIQWGHSEWS